MFSVLWEPGLQCWVSWLVCGESREVDGVPDLSPLQDDGATNSTTLSSSSLSARPVWGTQGF